MVDLFDECLSPGYQAGQDKAGRCPQVPRGDRAACKRIHAVHHDAVSGLGQVRSHFPQFHDVHEAVVENIFGDHGAPFGNAVQRSELGLHVRGETGEGRGIDIDCPGS